MKRWRCIICGYLHDGERPPYRCPICGAPARLFEAVNERETPVGGDDPPPRGAGDGKP